MLPWAGWPPEPLSHLAFVERLTEFVVIMSLMGAALAPTDPVLASDVQAGPPGEG